MDQQYPKIYFYRRLVQAKLFIDTHTGVTPSAYLARHQKMKAQMRAAPLDFVPGCFAEKNGWLKK